MKEHPILFSGPMVRAIPDGTKTQTRRVVKPQPIELPGDEDRGLKPASIVRYRAPSVGTCETDLQDAVRLGFIRCPYGHPGDRLWVRETWRLGEQGSGCFYQADGGYSTGPEFPRSFSDGDMKFATGKWHPSIHMPRWASRITLEITDVRVQRLQDISGSDAVCEGAVAKVHQPIGGHSDDMACRVDFRILWDSINYDNGYGWDTNPWVWAISFRRIV